MAFCQHCGAQLADGAAFCTSCGSSVGAAAPVVAASSGGPTAREAPQGPATLTSSRDVLMTKKILSLHEHYDLQDPQGNPLGEAEGNLVQLPARFVVKDRSGAEVVHLAGKLVSLRREFEIYDPSGNPLAAIKKKIVKLFGSEYWLEKDGSEFMRVYGNFVEHDYRVQLNGVDVAQVHKNWVTVRDQFGISITGEVDIRLVLGAVIVVEHEEVTERRSGTPL
ncbi:MAG: LURP-one-related family protein [Nitrososphaerales archaeon]|jgi:uncharacterized protein YxjI